MPMLYRDGAGAFLKLQEEIMKSTDDQSLFAWKEGDRKTVQDKNKLGNTNTVSTFAFSLADVV